MPIKISLTSDDINLKRVVTEVAVFSAKNACIISETAGDRINVVTVSVFIDSKLHTHSRLVLKSMTLDGKRSQFS